MAWGKPIFDRICKAFDETENDGFIIYYDLAQLVFSRSEFPSAWVYPTKGGPPGCYMSLSRTIREFKIDWSMPNGGGGMCHAWVWRPRLTGGEDE